MSSDFAALQVTSTAFWKIDMSRSNQTAEVADDWFVRLMGLELGPMSTTSVLEMIDKGELIGIDQVRRGIDSDWLSAAEMGGLFSVVSTGNSAYEPAERCYQTPGHLKDEPATESVSLTSDPSKPGSDAVDIQRADRAAREESSGDDDGDWCDDATQRERSHEDLLQEPLSCPMQPPTVRNGLVAPAAEKSSVESQRSRVLKRFLNTPRDAAATAIGRKVCSRRTVRFAAAVGIAVLALWFVSPQATSTQQIHEHYSVIWTAMSELSINNEPSTWSEFAHQQIPTVQGLVDELESSADLTRPARLELLYAGRDHLLIMLQASSPPSPGSKDRFMRHMADAKQLFVSKRLPTDELAAPPQDEWLKWATATPSVP